MKAKCSPWRLAWTAIRMLVFGILLQVSFPFVGGEYYSLCGDRSDEQRYLDGCIHHLKDMRAACGRPGPARHPGLRDPSLSQGCAWDVMVVPLSGPFIAPGGKVIGCNCPWCPGITLDPCLLRWRPEDTALVVAHEAMHDDYPFLWPRPYQRPRTEALPSCPMLSDARARNDRLPGPIIADPPWQPTMRAHQRPGVGNWCAEGQPAAALRDDERESDLRSPRALHCRRPTCGFGC